MSLRKGFRAACRQHPADGSATVSLERRGLDRENAHGKEGFVRIMALVNRVCDGYP